MFLTTTFQGMVLPRHQVKPTLLGLVDRASLYQWLKNIRTMDEAQITDCSNTVPSSKTFRDEHKHFQKKSNTKMFKCMDLQKLEICYTMYRTTHLCLSLYSVYSMLGPAAHLA
jgi:hypothetical protein